MQNLFFIFNKVLIMNKFTMMIFISFALGADGMAFGMAADVRDAMLDDLANIVVLDGLDDIVDTYVDTDWGEIIMKIIVGGYVGVYQDDQDFATFLANIATIVAIVFSIAWFVGAVDCNLKKGDMGYVGGYAVGRYCILNSVVGANELAN